MDNPTIIIVKERKSNESEKAIVKSEISVEKVKLPQTSSATDLMTYTWKDINVWIGPPPTQNENENAELGAVGSIGEIEKNSCGHCCSKHNRTSKHLLRNVTGIVRPGELVAIMGASGAGKTTLLNALNFRSGNELSISGQRCLNGVPIGPDTLTSLSAYVQQDDLFIGTLTVKEHLTFYSLVRMDANIPYEARRNRVHEVLREFGLEKCKNTQIGYPGRLVGISGGERKRLAFASEVLTDPKLMFCDEPTSGLDSYMAENIVMSLKLLATLGKTIICTIHQPSSQVYNLFDRVLLLAEGRVAFLGSTDDALKFFDENGFPCPQNFNPSDFYIQTLAIQPGKVNVCRATVKRICDNFDKSEYGKEIKNSVDAIKVETEAEEFLTQTAKRKKASPYKISWMRQFNALLWRSWIAYIKDPMVLRMRFLQCIILSLLIGFIFFGQEANQDGVQNMDGALFLSMTHLTMANVFGVIDVFCLEMPIFIREHFNGMYRTDVYFLAKMLAESPLYNLLPVIYISLNYFMIGFNPEIESFLKIMGVLILVSNFGCSLGYFISCVTSSVSKALVLGPAMIIPFMLFSGFLMNAGSIPDYLIWLKYSSFFFYGNEALAIAQWETITTIKCNRNNATCPHSGAVVLQSLDYKPENFIRDIGALCGLIVLCRIIAYLALLSKTRRK